MNGGHGQAAQGGSPAGQPGGNNYYYGGHPQAYLSPYPQPTMAPHAASNHYQGPQLPHGQASGTYSPASAQGSHGYGGAYGANTNWHNNGVAPQAQNGAASYGQSRPARAGAVQLSPSNYHPNYAPAMYQASQAAHTPHRAPHETPHQQVAAPFSAPTPNGFAAPPVPAPYQPQQWGSPHPSQYPQPGYYGGPQPQPAQQYHSLPAASATASPAMPMASGAPQRPSGQHQSGARYPGRGGRGGGGNRGGRFQNGNRGGFKPGQGHHGPHGNQDRRSGEGSGGNHRGHDASQRGHKHKKQKGNTYGLTPDGELSSSEDDYDEEEHAKRTYLSFAPR